MFNQTQRNMKPRQNIKIASVLNLRDLGGWPTQNGSGVRYGLLYRSAQLDKLDGPDADVFGGLGIRSIYDMRTEPERSAKPDRVPPGAEYIVIDVLRDAPSAAPAQLIKVLADPKAAADMLGGGKAVTLFKEGYRQFVTSPSALSAYRHFFLDLLSEAHRPALFHCTTGKDRTGWAAAALLTLLGVSDEMVMHEFLLTNEQLVPALQPVLDRFQSQGGDPELLLPIIGVQEEYLEAAFDEMCKHFGTIEGYFAEGLGIDAENQLALRTAFCI